MFLGCFEARECPRQDLQFGTLRPERDTRRSAQDTFFKTSC